MPASERAPLSAPGAVSELSRRRFLGTVSVAGLGVAALTSCGDSDSGAKDGSGRTVVEWWHIMTTEPARGRWNARAKAFEKAHPEVRIKIVMLENDAFKSKLTALT